MITGIGIDLVEINRIKEVARRQDRFVNRILTDKEKSMYRSLSKKRSLEFLAGRFAAKEAYVKALGTGIGQVSFLDIEILPDDQGRPVFTRHPSSNRAILSITHTDELAAAQVLLQKP